MRCQCSFRPSVWQQWDAVYHEQPLIPIGISTRADSRDRVYESLLLMMCRVAGGVTLDAIVYFRMLSNLIGVCKKLHKLGY